MLHQFRSAKDLQQRAKELRQNQTRCERILWQSLRAKRCQGCKFRRQAPLGLYIVDFLCVEKKLIVEIDGDTHFEGSALAYDEKRTMYFRSQGFSLLRFSNSQIRESLEWVINTIKKSLDLRAAFPSYIISIADGDFRRSALEAKE